MCVFDVVNWQGFFSWTVWIFNDVFEEACARLKTELPDAIPLTCMYSLICILKIFVHTYDLFIDCENFPWAAETSIQWCCCKSNFIWTSMIHIITLSHVCLYMPKKRGGSNSWCVRQLNKCGVSFVMAHLVEVMG